jgi:hypothetical protein
MKSINHHFKKLMNLMIKAESVTTRSEAQKVLRKTRKHQEKLEKLRRLLRLNDSEKGGS